MNFSSIEPPLRALREKHSLTPQYVADHLHISLSRYLQYEAAEVIPSLSMLIHLCELYQLTDDVLLDIIFPDAAIDKAQAHQKRYANWLSIEVLSRLLTGAATAGQLPEDLITDNCKKTL